MTSKLSVVLCTHNPRPEYLNRALQGLHSQTLPRNRWELLLIDNHSSTPVAGRYDVGWHPDVRNVREELYFGMINLFFLFVLKDLHPAGISPLYSFVVTLDQDVNQ